MRLIRFSRNDGPAQLGLLIDDKAVALADLVSDAPADARSAIAGWDALAPRLAAADASGKGTPLAEVKLLSPLDGTEKMMAIGLNYADHIEEARGEGLTIPTEQVWFSKQANSLAGPFDGIELPKVSDKLDYEVELVAIIGKGGRHISAADAPAHIFGYAVGNDVSVRDWQTKTPQWVLGKSFDTHGPIGPAIVTADELGDPHGLSIKSFVNGELRQNSNTKHLVFNVWKQIEELSKVMTLKPGDVIFTGTPGGVGLAFRPPRFLKVGDVVRCEIDKLGAIENTVVAEA
ncbi:MAG: fumarylacetoacetate hydrolase family protein [Rhodobacter sp.]|nr:fumarylacetoacetate hydrolase family protein [Paracoccaceae bacterium]MCC0077566.1 fumarylacetoacetate hydrolase family protein [Rhodobacter sp.]